MTESLNRKPGESAALLIGILLTVAALVSHQFIPKRQLALEGTREGADFLLWHWGEGTEPKVAWVDKSRFHYTCRFAKDTTNVGCSFTYLLNGTTADEGTDLSRFQNLKLAIRYAGNARQLRVAIRNFDPAFSNHEDANSSKFNSVNLHPKDLVKPLSVNLDEFTVPEWWVTQYDLPREQGYPDFRNAMALSIDLLGDLAGTNHDIKIDQIEFSGDWISAELWYLGILCVWLLAGTSYGVTQLVQLRRQWRVQDQKLHELVNSNVQLESEKVKYQKLSTVDALTKVLNRHGIDQFVESLRLANLPTSVIVVDLDYFKRINDQRGHHVGDRVLTNVGEILKSCVRNTDGLGRWGGEEFALVCPGASLSKAADLAEKLRHRIMQTNFIPEDPIAVTASFGVATSQPDGSFEDVFRQADEALYLAKSRGRNCVVAAGEDQMHRVTGAGKGTWALLSGRFRLHK